MVRNFLFWLSIGVLLGLPLILAAQSPLLAWRDAIYIAAGFAGILAMTLLVLQPLLAMQALPVHPRTARQLHKGIGIALLALVLAHVVGLWRTSPPDVVDALTFTSPTPFSVWGVLAMWALFGSAILAANRRRLPPRIWRGAHLSLGLFVILGSIAHALLIEGSMESISKWMLATALLGTSIAMITRRLKQK